MKNSSNYPNTLSVKISELLILSLFFIVLGVCRTVVAIDWQWQTPVPSGIELHGVWGCSGSDVFAVGDAGTILHFDRTNWIAMNSGITNNLSDIWGSTCSDVYAVGTGGIILHYNGVDWNAMNSGITNDLNGVWGSSPSNVFAVGTGGVILNYDRTNWTIIHSDVTNSLNDIWGSSPSNVFAVGDGGVILFFDGTSWSAVNSPKPNNLNSIWGNSGSNVFAVGTGGLILNYNGVNWKTMNSGTTSSLFGVGGISDSDVFVVGAGGIILGFDGTAWSHFDESGGGKPDSIWGDSGSATGSGSGFFAVGLDGSICHGYTLRAHDDSYVIEINASLHIPAPGILANDKGAPLTATIVSEPYYGTVTLNADGSFIYTPDVAYEIIDSFSYIANDGTADSNEAMVMIEVNELFIDNLTTTIQILKMLTGIPTETINLNIDIKNDGKVGVEEAIFFLQKAAKLR